MILSELRTLTSNFIAYDNDAYVGESPSNSDINSVINWAIRSIARRLYLFEPRITLTTSAGIGRYDISDTTYFERKLLDVHRVIVSGTILRDNRSQFGLYPSIDSFDARFPTWRTASNGTPTGAVLTGQVLTFDCPASGALSNTFVSGRFIPNDLTADGQSPLIPTELHELIAYLAAMKFTLPTATEEEQWLRLRTFRQEAVDLLPELYVRQYTSVHGVPPSIVPGASTGGAE